jgi:hypothetical protein
MSCGPRSNSYEQAQSGIVSNAALANEGHCIDLGTGIVVGTEKSDVLDSFCDRSRSRSMLLARNFTLPLAIGALVSSFVKDVGIATLQPAIA